MEQLKNAFYPYISNMEQELLICRLGSADSIRA